MVLGQGGRVGKKKHLFVVVKRHLQGRRYTDRKGPPHLHRGKKEATTKRFLLGAAAARCWSAKERRRRLAPSASISLFLSSSIEANERERKRKMREREEREEKGREEILLRRRPPPPSAHFSLRG